MTFSLRYNDGLQKACTLLSQLTSCINRCVVTLILWVKGQVELRDYCSSTAQVVVTIIICDSWLKLRAETVQICSATRA